ncbi:MAG: hypothetical protein J2P13_04610, partial [Acidobacteria bacterium]|nr:hypothetical protein [Acidobacteriota bacterium]
DLAYLYEQGKGVPLDYIAAYEWYKAAWDGGERRAGSRLKGLRRIMTEEQVAKATAAASELAKSHARPSDYETAPPIGGSLIDSR